jgi:hypothetical protein
LRENWKARQTSAHTSDACLRTKVWGLRFGIRVWGGRGFMLVRLGFRVGGLGMKIWGFGAGVEG